VAAAVAQVGRVQHVPVADRDAADLLLGCVAAGLVEGVGDGAPIPRERAGSLGLDDEVLDAESRKQDVRIADLMVQVPRCPVQDGRQEVLDDALGGPLGRVPETSLLLQALLSCLLKVGPAATDPLIAATV